jgi:predicted nuclease of predicted toxin-antitoxin system
VRLLIYANLSPKVATRVHSEGYDAVHVSDIGLLTASDEAILAHAATSGQVIVSADTDFGELLAVSGASRPSVVLLRSADHLTPDQQGDLLVANLPTVAAELEAGAVASIARGRLRVRPLPVQRTDGIGQSGRPPSRDTFSADNQVSDV